MHCEPKHLSLREIKLARYLISAYSATRTVEVHSAAHADSAYRRSNAGQRLHHTLAYNPHKRLSVRMCMNASVCVWQRRRDREKGKVGKSVYIFFFHECQQQWSGCFVTVIGRAQEMHRDVASHSWISSAIRIDFFLFSLQAWQSIPTAT